MRLRAAALLEVLKAFAEEVFPRALEIRRGHVKAGTETNDERRG